MHLLRHYLIKAGLALTLILIGTALSANAGNINMAVDTSGGIYYDPTAGFTTTAGATPETTYLNAPTAPAAQPAAVTPGVNDPATLALYQQQIGQYNQAIQGLPVQLQGADNQIQSAYQGALGQLTSQANQAKASYGTGTTQNQQGYVTNKNAIGTNAGQSLNGLLRLLGSRGAGGSSAALFSAPQAVAQQATQQRSAAGQTYGQNQQGLDNSYNNYLQGNTQDINNIGLQRDQNLNSAQAQSDSTRAGLLQQLATLSAQQAAASGASPTNAAAPYLSQAQNYLTNAGQLGLKTFTPQYNQTAYTAPSAASYSQSQFAAPQSTTSNPGILNTTVAPALNSLLKPKLSGVSA